MRHTITSSLLPTPILLMFSVKLSISLFRMEFSFCTFSKTRIGTNWLHLFGSNILDKSALSVSLSLLLSWSLLFFFSVYLILCFFIFLSVLLNFGLLLISLILLPMKLMKWPSSSLISSTIGGLVLGYWNVGLNLRLGIK